MDWHRLFGLILLDFFTDSPFLVELEKDLSARRQLLDVVILRKGKGRFAGRLPDGLEDLADHNLITFKSYQEALDDWALKELTGHYVNYRKQVSPANGPLLPEGSIRLYAVCARYPHKLAAQVLWEESGQGVYTCRRGTDVIRVIVLHQLPEEEHNAPLHLFSAVPERVRFGQEHYQQRSEATSTLLRRLFGRYHEEGVLMSYTMADFRRDYVKELFRDLTQEERREALKNLPPEERLAGLSLAEIEDYLKRQRESGSSSSRKPRASRKGRGRPNA